MNLYVAKPNTAAPNNLWKSLIAVLVIVVLVFAAAFFLWSRSAPQTSSHLAFEILGFEGDAQIYDLQTRSWREPKRGEDFVASQELRTGADGMINFQMPDEIRMRLKENSSLKNEMSRMAGRQEIFKLRLSEGVLLGSTTRQFERKQKAKNADLEVLMRDSVADIYGAIFRAQATGQESKVGVLRGSVEVSKPGIFFRKQGIRVRGLEEAIVQNGVVQPATQVTPEAWGLLKESYELIDKTAVMEAEQIDLSRNAGSLFNYVFDHGAFYTPKVSYANRDFFKDPDSGQVFLEAEYDVFPTGSYSGVYIKTRDFDISKHRGMSFEVRRNPEEGTPDSFFIELKSKGNVVRRFSPKTFERNWKLVEFDFHAKKTTPVNEITFVFTNARVGESKKGVLEFRGMNLIPLPAPVTPVAASEATASPVMPDQPAATASSETPAAAPAEAPLQ